MSRGTAAHTSTSGPRVVAAGFVPTLYSAIGRTDGLNIQDLLLVDRRDPSLQGLAALGEADCEADGALFVRESAPAWLPAWRGDGAPRWVRQWLAEAGPGYCETTTKAGNCEHGNKGIFDLLPHEAMSWEEAAHACMRRCLRCPRCRFVSLSLQWQDCSWFHSCSGRRTDVAGFRTGPRLRRSQF